jgi:hypothetical protein
VLSKNAEKKFINGDIFNAFERGYTEILLREDKNFVLIG